MSCLCDHLKLPKNKITEHFHFRQYYDKTDHKYLLAISECVPGVYSSVQGDPCTNCLCGNDGRHTDVCMAVTCFRPQCPAGTILTLTPGTCCDYECKPLENGKCFQIISWIV